MAVINRIDPARWRNFHDTLERTGPDLRSLDAIPGAGEQAAAFLSRTAGAVMGLLAEAGAGQRTLQVLGSAWSFSPILAGTGILLKTDGAAAIFPPEAMLTEAATGRRFVLVSGGTTIHALNRHLRADKLSLRTSGAHDGQTVAGAIGTSVHGSAIGFGPFQNQVVGIHLVTGPSHSVWLEAGPQPLLDPGRARMFAREVLIDPARFAAAQVHLGGLGFVNAVLMEVVPRFDLAMVSRKPTISVHHLDLLAQERFREFAELVWEDATAFFPEQAPYYVEVIYNPFALRTPDTPLTPRPRPSVVYLGYRVPPAGPPGCARGRQYTDTIDRIWQQAEDITDFLMQPWKLPEAIIRFLGSTPASGDRPKGQSWGKVFGPPDWRPIDIYNAAFAVPVDRLRQAIGILETALFAEGDGNAGPLVFTIRFVADSQGLLAFQRFARTAVINVDGIRCARAASSAVRMAAALDRSTIPFSQHWGKQGEITAARIARESAPAAPSPLGLERWRRARNQLLAPDMRLVFRNDALVDWGLL